MFEPRYYTLVGMDTDSDEGMPLFGVTDKQLVSRSGKPYLEEFLPHHFRLLNSAKRSDQAVHCPRCGKEMRCINSRTQEHTLYTCDDCYRTTPVDAYGF